MSTKVEVTDKIEQLIETLETRVSEIHYEYKEGTGNRWYEARAAYNLLAIAIYELKHINKG